MSRAVSRNLFRRAAVVAILIVAIALPLYSLPAKKHPPRESPDVIRFHRDVDAALAGPLVQQSFVGILIMDAESGKVIYDLNSGKLFTPASNTKLFTTAFALSSLGPDYRFHTTIETHGTLDPAGRLRGDLFLVGRGDPDLSNRAFPYDQKNPINGPPDQPLVELVDEVVAKGVKEIDGDVLADDSYFPYDPIPPGWAYGDLPFYYGAPVSAICLDDNSLDVKVTPGATAGAPAWVTVEPWPGYDVYAYNITTGAPESPVEFDVVGIPGAKPYLLRGSIPIGHAPMDLPLSMPDPANYAAHVLKQLLLARGIRITGHARAQHAPPPVAGTPLDPPAPASSAAQSPTQGPEVLAERISPPLIEIVRALNKTSQNLHAELLLRTAAKVKTGTGSMAAGLSLEQDFLKSIGVPDGSAVFDDGSGLSRENLVTPRAVVTLLEYIRRQPWGDAFVTTLPVAGIDGTLDNRMLGTPAEGRIDAKTGSVEHVRAMSGFATTLSGEHLIFSMFINNYGAKTPDATKIFDAISEAMVQDLGRRPKASGKPRKRR